ncbi:MAG TPA: nitroreductase family protein [Verrucomicrobiota bacterium]|nr:nitroreductase family protein [Verrucomicrobiota bacterium]HNU49885.1 nitroreductase family protein [Verrucomicrobiota bacterium]
MTSIPDDRIRLLLGRRSIRVYRPEPIPEETVAALLAAAMSAPSAAAKDPWRFVVVREPERLAALAEALPNGGMLAAAPLGIVVCGDLEAAHGRELSYLLQDCAAATENLLLAAHALGLGACWLGIHPRADRVRRVGELLALPPQVLPVAGIALGPPAETKEARTRFNPAFVHREQWR